MAPRKTGTTLIIKFVVVIEKRNNLAHFYNFVSYRGDWPTSRLMFVSSIERNGINQQVKECPTLSIAFL